MPTSRTRHRRDRDPHRGHPRSPGRGHPRRAGDRLPRRDPHDRRRDRRRNRGRPGPTRAPGRDRRRGRRRRARAVAAAQDGAGGHRHREGWRPTPRPRPRPRCCRSGPTGSDPRCTSSARTPCCPPTTSTGTSSLAPVPPHRGHVAHGTPRRGADRRDPPARPGARRHDLAGPDRRPGQRPRGGVRPLLPPPRPLPPQRGGRAHARRRVPTARTAIRFFHDRGVKHTVHHPRRRGRELRRRPDEPETVVPAYQVEVVDTTGCGDAFSAGYLTGLAEGATPRGGRARRAAGSCVATGLGSDAGLTTRSALDAFMATTPRVATIPEEHLHNGCTTVHSVGYGVEPPARATTVRCPTWQIGANAMTSWRTEAERVARGIRLRVFEHVLKNGEGYLSQALSSAEMFALLYGPVIKLGPVDGPARTRPFPGVPGPATPGFESGDRFNGAPAPTGTASSSPRRTTPWCCTPP
jgi:hypothetical protein